VALSGGLSRRTKRRAPQCRNVFRPYAVQTSRGGERDGPAALVSAADRALNSGHADNRLVGRQVEGLWIALHLFSATNGARVARPWGLSALFRSRCVWRHRPGLRDSSVGPKFELGTFRFLFFFGFRADLQLGAAEKLGRKSGLQRRAVKFATPMLGESHFAERACSGAQRRRTARFPRSVARRATIRPRAGADCGRYTLRPGAG